MPIYEYLCEKCGSHTEVIQKVADAPLKRCKSCRGKLRKLISRAGFQFKGSGWYATDYAGKGLASKDTAEETTAGKTSEKKKDSGSDGGAPATAAD
jgi:putative FmdB family regulatory protein